MVSARRRSAGLPRFARECAWTLTFPVLVVRIDDPFCGGSAFRSRYSGGDQNGALSALRRPSLPASCIWHILYVRSTMSLKLVGAAAAATGVAAYLYFKLKKKVASVSDARLNT